MSAVLLLAGSLKLYAVATPSAVASDLESRRWLTIGLAEAELVLAIFLSSGIFGALVWKLAIAAFWGFVAVSGYKAISGESTCGCFGPVAVNPWLMLAFDLMAVTALLLYRRPKERLEPRAARIRGAITVGVAMLTVGATCALVIIADDRAVTQDAGFISSESFVLLEPERWVGRPFLLARHVDVGNELLVGRWRVVLYHYDCPECRKVIRGLESQALDSTADTGRDRLALIEVPPFAPPGKSPVPADTQFVVGRLDGGKKWFVHTPSSISLSNGIVVAANEGATGAASGSALRRPAVTRRASQEEGP